MYLIYSSLGLAVPPRVRFLQKWKKAKEAKKKEKETLSHTMVEDLAEKLNKSSNSEVSSESEDEPERYQPSSKDTYNFHNGKLIFFLLKPTAFIVIYIFKTLIR